MGAAPEEGKLGPSHQRSHTTLKRDREASLSCSASSWGPVSETLPVSSSPSPLHPQVPGGRLAGGLRYTVQSTTTKACPSPTAC